MLLSSNSFKSFPELFKSISSKSVGVFKVLSTSGLPASSLLEGSAAACCNSLKKLAKIRILHKGRCFYATFLKSIKLKPGTLKAKFI